MFNSTITSSPSSIDFRECLKGIYFGFIFSYSAMSLCFILATPANLWYLWFYVSGEPKVKETHVLPVNYIIIELLFCFECAAEMINIFILNNKALYMVINFFMSISWSGKPLIQTCICVEQYLAVCHPVTFLRYKGIKYRNAAASAVWVLSFGYTAYQLNTMAFPDPVISSMFIIALAVISFCCVSVLRALKHSGPGNMRNQTVRDVGNQQKRNAFNTISLALLVIMFSYPPQALLTVFTHDNTDTITLECSIAPLMTSFNVLSVIITPFLKLYREGHLNCLNFYRPS